jgi:type I restriction enzyme M protein
MIFLLNRNLDANNNHFNKYKIMTSEQQRAELHRTIWQIANDLRGAVDAWDFKQYVLGFLFYRFISENITEYFNKRVRATGDKDFDYVKYSDKDANIARQDAIQEKGYFILPSELFINVAMRAKGDTNLNETLQQVFKSIENSAKGCGSEQDFDGLFQVININDNKLGESVEKRNARLVKIIEAINNMALGDFADHNIDLFGDTYEYLIAMYASNAGKSGGEFFTPQEVAELLARIVIGNKKKIDKVYDPACGSGSLLLKFAKILGKDKVGGFYGQEINPSTHNLCRMNMFLHNINYDKFDIVKGNTLLNPSEEHLNMRGGFDAIVSNPPYSVDWGGDTTLMRDDSRFSPAGVLAPDRTADLAFVMQCLHLLAINGTAAIVSFPGVLYRTGREQKIREYLIKENRVDCVIQLPKNLFFGTSIQTCILVLKKSKSDNSVLFINASDESIHVGNKDKLSPENIDKILKAYVARKDIEFFAKLVKNADIAENKSNLSVTSYVESKDKKEAVDIKTLNAEIEKIVNRENELRKEINKIVKELEG